MKHLTMTALLALILLASCTRKNTVKEPANPELKGELKISGSSALGPLMNIWAAEFMKLHPQVGVEVIRNGSGQGITDLLSGKTQLAMISDKLPQDEVNRGLWKVSVTREGVVAIVNSSNPMLNLLEKKGIPKGKLNELFSGNAEMTWGFATGTGDASPVTVYIRADKSGAAALWAAYLKLLPEQLKGWPVTGDTGIINHVLRDPNALSFCNAHYVYDVGTDSQLEGLRVLPIDVNENGRIDSKEKIFNKISDLHHAAYLGSYSHVLCRDLSLVCMEKPAEPVLAEFIRWIAGEGQPYAVDAGYCELRECETK